MTGGDPNSDDKNGDDSETGSPSSGVDTDSFKLSVQDIRGLSRGDKVDFRFVNTYCCAWWKEMSTKIFNVVLMFPDWFNDWSDVRMANLLE